MINKFPHSQWQNDASEFPDSSSVHFLLWTGGWDSTYRLLTIVLIERNIVQPIYIIDPNRKSVAYELKAMQQIRELVKKNYSEYYSLIRPTKYYDLKDIHPDEKIQLAYKRLLVKHPALGSQNEWLARFTSQYKINNLEIGLQKSMGANFGAVKKLLKQLSLDGRSIVRIPPELKNSDEYQVFGNFCFPLFDITKSEMLHKAKAIGFEKLMYVTWFCHRPLRSGKPCGVCVPCAGVVRDGLEFRLPLYSRIRNRFRIFLSKDYFKNRHPKIYNWMRKLKH